MHGISPSVSRDVRNRVSKIEGQARGVQRMLDEGRSCQEILQQLMAIRSAAHQASLILARSHALECLRHPDQSMSTEEIVNTVMSILAHVPH